MTYACQIANVPGVNKVLLADLEPVYKTISNLVWIGSRPTVKLLNEQMHVADFIHARGGRRTRYTDDIHVA